MQPSLPRRALIGAAAATLTTPRLAAAQAPRVLKFVPEADLGAADPVWSAAYVSRNHGLMVFDMLYGMDAQYRIQPQMAAGHTVSEDGLTWTITLRDGLLFHDGEKVLAKDCVASIKRFCVRDSLGQSLAAVTEELVAVDDRTLRFRLKRRFPLLTYAIGKGGSPICAIMPERLALTDPFRQVSEMIGSGPYRFLPGERVAGARVGYARNTAYVPREGTASFCAGPKLVHFDRVEWHILPDPSTAAAALRTGEVDWWQAPTFDLLRLLQRDRRISLTAPDPAGFIGTMRFNQLHPPFDNPAIRRAILPALVQADFVGAVAGDYPGGWKEGIGYFNPNGPMGSDAGLSVLTGPRDLEAAKRALVAAGYKGEPVVLLAPSDLPTLKTLADVSADLMKRIGFKVDYVAMDWGTTIQRLTNQAPPEQGGWNLFHTYWTGLDFLDPGIHPYIRGNGRAGRAGWPSSAKLEALRDAWLAAETMEEQQRLARELQVQAFEDLPSIPLGQILPPMAHRADLRDLVVDGFPVFWGVKRA